MTDQHTCPRRLTEIGPWQRDEELDSWTTGHGLVGQDTVGLSCSFCGSLHPDRFMELVRDGWTVGPTDKSYKAYLEPTPTDEQIAQAKANWIANDAVARALRESGQRAGRTSEEIAAELDHYWGMGPRVSAGAGAKFYFQHLSPEQRDEFIALHNAKQMKIGAPGYFYQPPFFTRPASE